jgi:hypothetical protein
VKNRLMYAYHYLMAAWQNKIARWASLTLRKVGGWSNVHEGEMIKLGIERVAHKKGSARSRN